MTKKTESWSPYFNVDYSKLEYQVAKAHIYLLIRASLGHEFKPVAPPRRFRIQEPYWYLDKHWRIGRER